MDEPTIARVARATTEGETDPATLELMRAVASQNRNAFKTLYERYAPRLGSYLLKLLKQPERVDEAVNDVMLAVWQNADRFDPAQGRLLTWLFGIAHHKGLKALRHAGRSRAEVSFNALSPPDNDREEPKEALLAVEPHHHHPECTVMGWELGRALTWALDRLSPEHRAVIELTFGEERSYLEIAGIMDCPVNTVKTRMFHARKKLAHLLAQCGHGEFVVAPESLP
ncbi:MAG: sigma-70 family RNA polymerase sigma factor [Candidatus Competibacter sp.]